jgi:hypothetical protein
VTRVCLVGDADVNVRYELLSRETARAALSTYALGQPFENSLAVDVVSLGAAVSLLNDLDWYLVRFVDLALVLEPSVSRSEWLTRALATAIRDGDVDPSASASHVAVYGVDDGRLVEPLYAVRDAAGDLPDYDLRDVEDTVVVRVLPEEFE